MLRYNKEAGASASAPNFKITYEEPLTSSSPTRLVDRISFTGIKHAISSWFDEIQNSDPIRSFLSQAANANTTKDASDTTTASNSDRNPKEDRPRQTVNVVSDFQHASYFSAGFLYILAISSFSSVRTARRGVLLALGGTILAVWASFFSAPWDLGDSFRWLISFALGGAGGLYYGLHTPSWQFGQSACLLQATAGLASFLVGLAQYSSFDFFKVKVESVDKLLNVLVCLFGSTLFASAATAYFKLDKRNLAKKPLETIGRKRELLNTIVIVAISVLAALYMFFEWGWALWTIVVLSVYIGWGLTVSASPREMNLILPYQTFLTGVTITLTGFLLNRYYLLLVGALCITGGYQLAVQASKALNKSVHTVFFKSWAKEFSEHSIASNLEAFGYSGQMINDTDLVNELILSDNILIVPGNGLYQMESTEALSEISLALRLLNKNVVFCIHPTAGRIPGHMEAVLAEERVPFSAMKRMDEVNCSEFDLAVVIGVFEEVDPDKEGTQATCRVWEASKVIYVETKIEKYESNALFDKQNVSVLKGDTKVILANVIRDFQRKGFVDMHPEERNLYINGSHVAAAALPPVDAHASASGSPEINSLVEKATKVLGVLNEASESNKESRVAVTPSLVKPLLKNGVHVWIEKGAGKASGFSDDEYSTAGAKVTTANEIFSNSQIQVFISELNDKTVNLVSKQTELLIAPLPSVPAQSKSMISKLTQNDRLSVLDLASAPSSSSSVVAASVSRGSKLNSRANQTILAAYRSVFEGFYYLNKVARPLFNAAGRSPAAQVLVIGADALGLSLANIAKQYGANVKVFDKRDALKHTIKRSGFTPVEFVYEILDKNPNQVQDTQLHALRETLRSTDLVLIPASTQLSSEGKAVRVLTEELISELRHGAVIVDLAADKGGSTALTHVDKINSDAKSGVTVIGYTEATYCQKLNRQSSELHSFNVNHLFNAIVAGNPIADRATPILSSLDDESIREICWVFKGHDVSATRVKAAAHDGRRNSIGNEAQIPESAQAAPSMVAAGTAASAGGIRKSHDSVNSNLHIQNSEVSSVVEPETIGKNIDENVVADEERQSFTQRVSATLKRADALYEEQKEKAAVFLADSFGEKQEERINKNPGWFSVVITLLVLLVCLIVGLQTNRNFIFEIGIFGLSLLVGSTVVKQVDRGLNAPLLLFLQTLCGSIGVACMLVFSNGVNNDLWDAYSLIAMVGNMFAVACFVGGFTLTLKSVTHFTPQELKEVAVEE